LTFRPFVVGKKRVKISKVESEAVIQVWADNTITERKLKKHRNNS
jgi:hypothetical protein